MAKRGGLSEAAKKKRAQETSKKIVKLAEQAISHAKAKKNPDVDIPVRGPCRRGRADCRRLVSAVAAPGPERAHDPDDADDGDRSEPGPTESVHRVLPVRRLEF